MDADNLTDGEEESFFYTVRPLVHFLYSSRQPHTSISEKAWGIWGEAERMEIDTW